MVNERRRPAVDSGYGLAMDPLSPFLLGLLGASLSAGMSRPRAIRGPAHRKTYLDYVHELEGFKFVRGPASRFIELHGPAFTPFAMFLDRFLNEAHGDERAAYQMYLADRRTGGVSSRLQDPQYIASLQTFYYGIIASREDVPLWALDGDVFDALVSTKVPLRLLKRGLPRLPYPRMFITFPEDVKVPVFIYADHIGIDDDRLRELGLSLEDMDAGEELDGQKLRKIMASSILLIEEVPGKSWRWASVQDDVKGNLAQVATAFSRYDIEEHPDPTVQEAEFNKLAGQGAIFRLLLNLIIALHHRHLEGRNVEVTVPKSSSKRAKLLRRSSARDYTTVHLSQATKQEQEQLERRAEGASSKKGRHLVPGFYNYFWVKNPGTEVVYDTKPVENGEMSLVARWIFPHYRGSGPLKTGPKRYYRVKR